MAFDQPVEDVHVAVDEAGLLGGDDDVRAAQCFPGAHGDVQGHDLLEVFAGPASEVAARGRADSAIQVHFRLHDAIGAIARVGGQFGFQLRADRWFDTNAFASFDPPALPRLARTAEEVDRG